MHGVDGQMTNKDLHVGNVQMMNEVQEGHVRSENGEREMSDKLKNQMEGGGVYQLDVI